jgi:hypothetical protein
VELKNNQNYQKHSRKGTDVFDCRLSEYENNQAHSNDKQKSLPEKIDDLLGYAKLHKQRKRQPDDHYNQLQKLIEKRWNVDGH